MTDTSNISVTPEDRERLAKSKFGEWFNEMFDSRIEEAVKKHTSSAPRQQQQAQQSNGQEQQQPETRTRRRSLLETCLSDTFGF